VICDVIRFYGKEIPDGRFHMLLGSVLGALFVGSEMVPGPKNQCRI
jgi:hypothetical protein